MTTATVSPNAKAVDVPLCENTDPAALEAWYGNFGFAEHWRKVILANCREMIRAQAALTEIKLSEARIDDLARTHALYISFLTEHLDGRRLREQNVLDSQFSPVR
jgi:hypothetical protein